MQTDLSNIRCIAFDLDDTILNENKALSERTKAVLARAAEAGIALVPVSGRSWDTFPACVRELQGIACAVTSNGAAVYDGQTGQKVHGWLMEAKDVRAIMRSVGNFFLEGQITYEAFVDGAAHAAADYVTSPTRFGVPKSAVSYIQQTRRPNRYIIDFIFENAGKMDSLDLILKEPGMYRMIENTIRRNVENIYITSSVPYRMEISSAASGKASGLKYVLDQLELTPEQTVAFGDGDNDAPMLRFAGTGIAVKNASQSCRESADMTLKLSNQEDGVADYLEKYL